MKCIDLFSGLGGFSQAFIDRGYDVKRYDFDERFVDVPHTIIKDIRELTAKNLRSQDIILASPPCTHFSIASVSTHWPDGLPSGETLEQIDLIEHTIDIIQKANPRYWILENPRGMLKHAIGNPALTIFLAAYGHPYLKPTHLWGQLPPIDIKLPFKWEKAPRGSKKGTDNPRLDPAIKALIPYDFSLAVCEAVEGISPQQTLQE